jgi:hypothetical protein
MQAAFKEVVMLRKPLVVLAVALVLGTSGLSTSAFARGNHAGEGFGDTHSHRHAAYDNRTSSLRDGFRGYEDRDMWGHWGAYYGPML